MGSIDSDLDKFLRTDGLRIIYDSHCVRTEPYEPLTEEDIDDFDSMDLSRLNEEELEDLYDKADELQDDLAIKEPEDEASEEHDLWEDRISATEEFLDRIQDRLDELGNGE